MNANALLTWMTNTVLVLGTAWGLYRVALRRERCFGYNRVLFCWCRWWRLDCRCCRAPAWVGWLAIGRVRPVRWQVPRRRRGFCCLRCE